MPLRLQVISAHRESMGGSYIQEFAACGGTIGRSLECDWPLPDSKRFISGKHAMIDYQGGAYYLVDTSRNGVFINGSTTAVGSGNPQRLFDGDTIKLGEFEIRAALIDDASENSEDGMADSVVRAQMVVEDESMEIAMLDADKINDELTLDDVLRPGDESGELSMLREIPEGASGMLRKLASQALLKEAVETFLTSAGLKAADFDGIEPALLLQNAGRLLGEYTGGTHALLISKDKTTRQLRLGQLDGKALKNPLRSAESYENALRLLLGGSNDVNTQGPAAVRMAFAELAQHERAVIEAMRSALADYLGHFEPAAIERYAKEHGLKSTKAAFRELYTDAFEGLARPNDKKLPQRFDDEFARAYELESTD